MCLVLLSSRGALAFGLHSYRMALFSPAKGYPTVLRCPDKHIADTPACAKDEGMASLSSTEMMTV